MGANEISNDIFEHIEQYNREAKVVTSCTVLQIHDGIAHIYGLGEVMAGELIELEKSTIGTALDLEQNTVSIVLIGDGLMIQEKRFVKATGKIAQIHVNKAYLAHVINVLAKPKDSRGGNFSF